MGKNEDVPSLLRILLMELPCTHKNKNSVKGRRKVKIIHTVPVDEEHGP